MKQISEIIYELKKKWNTPLQAHHRGELTFFRFICSFSRRGVDVKNFHYNLPEDLVEFWSISDTAELFKDIDYGQWGLKILSPTDAIIRTQREQKDRLDEDYSTQLVIGEFLGDSDLLVISCDSRSGNFGKIFLSLPLDHQSDWPLVAESFSEFLEKYSRSEGDKYWEI